MTDVIDLNMLEELKEIMEEEFPSLLETFVTESARQYQEASQAWTNQDMEVLRRAAHSLKGSCSNVGAEQLRATCASLEDRARDLDGASIPELLSSAEVQLQAVTEVIQTYS